MPYKDKAMRQACNKRYRETHREQISARVAQWRIDNRDRHLANSRAWEKRWRMEHPDEAKARDKEKRMQNLDRIHAAHKRWRVKNTERLRHNYRKWKYGLTGAQYRDMLEKQGGLCAICGLVPKNGRFEVDHDHQTEIVRELLCHSCNCVLGYANESIQVLARASVYLAKHRRENGHNR